MRRAAIGAVALVALVAVALGSSGCSREPVVDAVRTTTTSDRPSAAAVEVIEALDAAADACGLLAVIDGGTPDDSLPAVYDAFAAAITRIAPSVDDDLSADWDDLGRTIKVTDAMNNVSNYLYDALNNRHQRVAHNWKTQCEFTNPRCLEPGAVDIDRSFLAASTQQRSCERLRRIVAGDIEKFIVRKRS